MPYIKREQRFGLDDKVDSLASHISSFSVEEQDGMINYTITKLLKKIYPRKYFHYNRAIGVLECVQQEFYRRQVSPYEDEKIKENGDVQ